MDAFGQAFGIGDEKVIAHQLYLFAQCIGEFLPAVPVFFSQAVFDRNDRILIDQVFIEFDHAICVFGGVVAGQVVEAVVAKEFRSCHIGSENDIFACGVAGFFNGFANDFHGCFIGRKVRRKAAFIADGSREAFAFEHRFQRLVHFRTHAERFPESRNAYRHDHAFLDVHVVVCMSTAVHDIHHRYRQVVCIHATEILVQRKAGRCCGCMSRCQRYAKNRIGAEAAFIFCAIQIDEDMVEASLVGSVPAQHGVSDFAIHMAYGIEDTFAIVAGFIAITKFSGFKHAGRSAGRHCSMGKSAVFQDHLYFYCRISAGIQNFSCMQIGNSCHLLFSLV